MIRTFQNHPMGLLVVLIWQGQKWKVKMPGLLNESNLTEGHPSRSRCS